MRRWIRTRLRSCAAVCVLAAALTGPALAEGTLIPVGRTVGIQISVDGVLVAGLAPVETETGSLCPAEEAGVRAGDVITEVNGQPVESAEQLADTVAAQTETELTILRGGRELHLAVSAAEEADGRGRLGLWLRDGITGIGTVTYIDPDTGAFGALGHGVNDSETGTLLPIDEGSVSPAQIVDVKRGSPGAPGELSGSFSPGEVIGRIQENTNRGIFGVLDKPLEGLRGAVPVASPEEVVSGPATILSCVAGGEVREYGVEIARAGFLGIDGRDLTVRVTDPELLALTGGIVQGMSGSPILQDGKLVGAITHVLTSDPSRGYGIYADRMLDAA